MSIATDQHEDSERPPAFLCPMGTCDQCDAVRRRAQAAKCPSAAVEQSVAVDWLIALVGMLVCLAVWAFA